MKIQIFNKKMYFEDKKQKKNDFLPAETGIALAGQKSNLFFLTQWVLLRSLDSKKIWYRYSVLRLRFTL